MHQARTWICKEDQWLGSRAIAWRVRDSLRMLVFVLAGLAFVSCAHVEVRDLGSGQHSLTAEAPSGGYAGSHEEAVQKANDYCTKFHQAAVIDGFYDKPGIGALGEHTSRIIFRCAAPKTLHF